MGPNGDPCGSSAHALNYKKLTQSYEKYAGNNFSTIYCKNFSINIWRHVFKSLPVYILCWPTPKLHSYTALPDRGKRRRWESSTVILCVILCNSMCNSRNTHLYTKKKVLSKLYKNCLQTLKHIKDRPSQNKLNKAVVVWLDMKFTTEFSKVNVPTRKFASTKDTEFFRKDLHDTCDSDLGKVLLLL